jgi:CRISPR/Cas system CMR-associated protein Cmr1 (group 7 of RAMP superfamily)
MLETVEKIAAAFGAAVFTLSTLTGLALWLFKTFGDRWLSSKFSERLEAFKHDQQKEIEHLRFEINKLFDRTTKLHQQEFIVLPKAWSLLVTSYSAARSMTASLELSPNLGDGLGQAAAV